jgi:protein-tyrosine-phosphatase/predicted ATP-grasp superfamily ATP-dependent carboligase
MPVLVLDGHSRAAVEVVQSLGRAGMKIDVSAEESDAIALVSRYVCRRLNQPPPFPAGDFQAWLRGVDGNRGYELIVPATESSLLGLRSLDVSDPLRRKAIIPGDEALDTALDKHKTLELARELGVAVPQSTLLSSIGEIGQCDSFPVVLKPVRSKVSVEGDMRTLAVVVARSEDQRRDVLRRWLALTPVLQQEYVRGHGMGVELLFDHGRKVWHFAHERLHEFPLSGGASSYRRSVNPSPAVLADAERLLIALGWHGVAMVESKMDAAGRHWLMEINPRLWGSLALSIDAGVDFPMGLLRLARGLKNPVQPAYRCYYTRDLRTDAHWLKANLKANHKDELLLTRPGLPAALELLRPLTGRESWDHFDWGDLKVTRRILSLTLGDQLEFLGRRLREWRLRRRLAKQHRTLVARTAESGAARKIVFLCTGNVCRSPFAARLAEQLLPQTEVVSAGFHSVDGRACPGRMLRVSRQFGADLSSHRSRRITRDQLEDADLVLAMDPEHLEELRNLFPEALPRATLLGFYAQPPILSIPDPYLADEDETRGVCKMVSSAIHGLVDSQRPPGVRYGLPREDLSATAPHRQEPA